MNEILDEVKVLVEQFETEANKAIAGNKAAATRARKVSVTIGKKLHEWRNASLAAEKK